MKTKFNEKLIVGFAWLSGLTLLFVFITITGFLFLRGYESLNLKLIFGDTTPLMALFFKKRVFDGLFPAIIGTITLVLLAVGIAIPPGTAAGIYMAEYCRGQTKYLLGLFFDILTGIPSIVIGLFGLSVTIFLHHHFFQQLYPSLLISALSLAFPVLPYLIRSTQGALEDIPLDIRLSAPAMGASHLQNIFMVLLPRSLSGIGSGIMLAIGRCTEDTAVIMLTGVVATAGIPHSLLGSYEALPFYIYYISSQYSSRQELQNGFGAAIILLAICALLFGFALITRQHLSRRFFYHL